MGLLDFLNGLIREDDTFRYVITDILHTRAIHTPSDVAYIFLPDGEVSEESITYRELDEAARTIASRLQAMNLKGERALMFFPPGLEFIKALYGAFYAGVIAVPAYPPRKNRSVERIKTIARDSGARVVLATNEIHQSTVRYFNDIELLKDLHWIVTEVPMGSPVPDHDFSTRPEDIALLQYTSGSTGQPKGVTVIHQNIMRNLEFLRVAFELTPDTKSVHWLPVFHDMGLIFGVMEPLYCGYTGILMPPTAFIQKPVRWLQAIQRYGAALGGAPNFAYDLCVSDITDEECSNLSLKSLRTLYNGAEPVRKRTLAAFSAKFKNAGFRPEHFYPTYGMAEATLILSGGDVEAPPVYLYIDKSDFEKGIITVVRENIPNSVSLVSVGRPRLDTNILIVEPNTLRKCGQDAIGEIWVSGSIVTRGYWNNPLATAETYQAYTSDSGEGPFLRTGDLGFYHEGELYISGRLKDLIIIRGRNYYPQDLEYLAEQSHPVLRQNASAAFSVEVFNDEKLVIVAEIERTALRELDTEAVCDAIRRNISEEFELEVYGILLLRTASIFKTSSGKIQRKACKEGFLHKALEVVGESFLDVESDASGPGQTDLIALQAWLMTWIHTRLKIPLERIDLLKPITVYGLNSMKAIQLQQDFLQSFGVNFPPYLFFEKISVRELCERALKLIQGN